jgi:hypothetical protein
MQAPPPAPPAHGQPAPPAQGYGQQWQQQGYGYGTGAAPKTLGMATAALVCGIAGLVVFNIVLGPMALVFGIVSRNKIKASNGALKGEGMALAGIILGPIDVVVWLAIIAMMS